MEQSSGVFYAGVKQGLSRKSLTQEKPRNKKGALFGLKDFIREPEP